MAAILGERFSEEYIKSQESKKENSVQNIFDLILKCSIEVFQGKKKNCSKQIHQIEKALE